VVWDQVISLSPAPGRGDECERRAGCGSGAVDEPAADARFDARRGIVPRDEYAPVLQCNCIRHLFLRRGLRRDRQDRRGGGSPACASQRRKRKRHQRRQNNCRNAALCRAHGNPLHAQSGGYHPDKACEKADEPGMGEARRERLTVRPVWSLPSRQWTL